MRGAWNHGNGTAGGGGLDAALVAAHGVILLMTSVVGVAANVFVFLAVYHQKSLRTANNALVVNLAASDLLRCGIDCPVLLSVVVSLHRTGRADALVCDTQAASFSFCCCLQLLTLACISAERYQAVAQPFKRGQRRRRVMVLIPLIWVLAALATVFCVLYVKDSLVSVRCRGSRGQSVRFYDTFGLYMLLPLWAGCFSVIIGFYVGIFALVRSHNRKIFDKGTSLVPKDDSSANRHRAEGSSGRGDSEQTQRSRFVEQVEETHEELNSTKTNPSAAPLTRGKPPQHVSISQKQREENKDLETEAPQCSVQTEGKRSRTNSDGDEPQKVWSKLDTENESESKTEKVTEVEAEVGRRDPSAPRLNPESASEPKPAINSNKEATSAVPTSHQLNANQALAVEGAVCMMPSKARGERVNKRREGKMATRAGYIILSFLVLWLPLISTILVNFAVYKTSHSQVKKLQEVEMLCVSVACVTALSDPLTYAAVNPQFQTEYHRIRKRVKTLFTKK